MTEKRKNVIEAQKKSLEMRHKREMEALKKRQVSEMTALEQRAERATSLKEKFGSQPKVIH